MPHRIRTKTNGVRVPNRRAIAADRALIDRCLAGEVEAWDALYRRCHHGLLAAIRTMFGSRQWDPNLVDEIAARVWFSVLTNDCELLARFDPGRGCRLTTYLATIARSEATTLFRSERRRRLRERMVSRPNEDTTDADEATAAMELGEFVQHLTPREMEFFQQFLLAAPGLERAGTYTDTNRWQLSSRIQGKLRRHFGES